MEKALDTSCSTRKTYTCVELPTGWKKSSEWHIETNDGYGFCTDNHTIAAQECKDLEQDGYAKVPYDK